MFKIALTAGHYRYTAGKRCLKKLDANETREWVLNARIAEKIETMLKDYDGYSLLRTDDPNGEKDLTIEERVAAANKFGADIYISLHHNAGIYGGKGGGIVAYVYKNCSEKAKEWQKDLYESLIKHTSLKGNRATPLASSNLYECRATKMPAVLLELGFMDSATDVPVILSEEYASSAAKAIVEVIVKKAGLRKKIAEQPKTFYRVQVGAFTVKKNAENLANELKGKGYSAVIKEETK